VASLARQFVKNGAQVLVNITNDGWFLESAESEQHLASARLRAIENRRPLLRCANTGVTVFIDERGRITHELRGADGRPFVEGVLTAVLNIPDGQRLTFYTRHGDVFAWLTAAITLVSLTASWRGRKAA
jgi:apolipoprotein N-acyltransferase